MDAMDIDDPAQANGSETGIDNQSSSDAAMKKELASASTPAVSNNAPGFKYKYPEAAPTPPGEDDEKWNKIFTAADSRIYNRFHKNANESRKTRLTGETYKLALTILAERNAAAAKVAADAAAGIVAPAKRSAKPKAPPKRKEPSAASSSRDATPSYIDRVPLSISEQIKSEGRARKITHTLPSSNHGSPGPTSAAKQSSPVPPPVKAEKPAPKKKGTTAPVKRPKTKAKPEGPKEAAANSRRASATPGLRTGPSSRLGSDDDSNDGGEYCICRGPDDHRMMVFCEGGCEDWYHCSCIGINVDDARNLLDRFICPKCSTKTAFTTWKRMCRHNNVDGCRKAARVSDDPPSKYCSDAHKLAFWEFVRGQIRSDEKRSMGGALSEMEVAALLDSYKSAADFHALGKKPKLPIPEGHDAAQPLGLQYITTDEQQTIEEIEAKRTVIEQRIQGYKTMQKLLIMINRRAKTAQEQPSVDVKQICGYDNRLAMNEAEFSTWCTTEEGRLSLETGVIGHRSEESKHIGAHVPYTGHIDPEPQDIPVELQNVCLKPAKKCKHFNWREIHAESYSYSQKNLREDLERLNGKKAEIIDDAEVREATKNYYAENTVEQLF